MISRKLLKVEARPIEQQVKTSSGAIFTIGIKNSLLYAVITQTSPR